MRRTREQIERDHLRSAMITIAGYCDRTECDDCYFRSIYGECIFVLEDAPNRWPKTAMEEEIELLRKEERI